jgi:hypothetical protein
MPSDRDEQPVDSVLRTRESDASYERARADLRADDPDPETVAGILRGGREAPAEAEEGPKRPGGGPGA